MKGDCLRVERSSGVFLTLCHGQLPMKVDQKKTGLPIVYMAIFHGKLCWIPRGFLLQKSIWGNDG